MDSVTDFLHPKALVTNQNTKIVYELTLTKPKMYFVVPSENFRYLVDISSSKIFSLQSFNTRYSEILLAIPNSIIWKDITAGQHKNTMNKIFSKRLVKLFKETAMSSLACSFVAFVINKGNGSGHWLHQDKTQRYTYYLWSFREY